MVYYLNLNRRINDVESKLIVSKDSVKQSGSQSVECNKQHKKITRK